MSVVAKFEESTGAVSKLREINGQIEALRKEAERLATHALKETCEGIFREHPDVQQFSWVQYGGEYNDEGAYHGVNEVLINDAVEENEYCGLGSGRSPSNVSAKIQTIIQALGTETLLAAFGTYHQVLVTRDTISVEHWMGY